MKRHFLLLFTLLPLTLVMNAQDSWNELTSGTTKGINDFYFSSISSGIAVGQGGLLQLTANGGSTWSPISIGTSQNLKQIKFTEPSLGWIVSSDGSVYSSTNGGSSWSGTSLGSDGLNAISWQGTKGIIVGDNGKTYSSTDAGRNWTYNGTLGVFTLNDVIYYNDTLAIACGGNGNLFRSVDNGSNWTAVSSGTTESLSAIAKAKDGKLVIVGTSGLILSYDPLLGNPSKEGAGLTTNWLTDVFCTENYCYAVGTNKTILIKGNGAWFANYFDDNISFTAIHFADEKNGFAGGIGGKLYKTTTAAGLISIKSIESSALELFPNPAIANVTVKGLEYPFSYEIFNLTGARIYGGVSSNGTIDINALLTGYYCIRLTGNTTTATLKFFKE